MLFWTKLEGNEKGEMKKGRGVKVGGAFLSLMCYPLGKGKKERGRITKLYRAKNQQRKA